MIMTMAMTMLLFLHYHFYKSESAFGFGFWFDLISSFLMIGIIIAFKAEKLRTYPLFLIIMWQLTP